MDKPPLGLTPAIFRLEDRLIEIGEAIDRYTKSFHPIPIEWVNEYNHLQGQLNSNKEKIILDAKEIKQYSYIEKRTSEKLFVIPPTPLATYPGVSFINCNDDKVNHTYVSIQEKIDSGEWTLIGI